jgi:predicted enzyme related to lactoylglutathione lyase
MSHGNFCWNELMAHDVEKAKAFYSKAVGWAFDGMPMQQGGTYWVAKVGDKPVGGIFPMDGPQFEGMPERWVSILAVDDVDARVKKATTAGAKIMKAPFDIPDVGRVAYIEEPGGAMVGWMTPEDTSSKGTSKGVANKKREPAAAR